MHPVCLPIMQCVHNCILLSLKFDCLKASGWVAASRLICCWTPEETRGASLGSLAFAARVSLEIIVK